MKKKKLSAVLLYSCVFIGRQKQKHAAQGLTNNDVQMSPERRRASSSFLSSSWYYTSSLCPFLFLSLSTCLSHSLCLSVSLSLALPYPFSFLFLFFLSPSLLLFIQALHSLSHSLFRYLSILALPSLSLFYEVISLFSQPLPSPFLSLTTLSYRFVLHIL